MKKLSLMEVLEGIEDTRRERSVWYPLEEVLFIMLVAVICGATSYVKVELFGKSKEEWLKKYIKLENGVPDAGEDVEKEEHSSIVGGIAGLYNHSGNQSGGSSENWT